MIHRKIQILVISFVLYFRIFIIAKRIPLWSINLLLASFARSVRQVMDRVFSFLLWPKREARGPWKQRRKKRGSITCPTDRANEANKMFIIWLCWLFRIIWDFDILSKMFVKNHSPGTTYFVKKHKNPRPRAGELCQMFLPRGNAIHCRHPPRPNQTKTLYVAKPT